MSQLQPLFTKGAIDQVTKLTGGGHANVKLVTLFAVLIFLTDVGQTLLSNIGGYLGDLMAIKQQKILSERYYEHVLSLPQAYFDTELTGKIINRMNRGIDQVSNFMQMLSNNFLQFIFSTVLTFDYRGVLFLASRADVVFAVSGFYWADGKNQRQVASLAKRN